MKTSLYCLSILKILIKIIAAWSNYFIGCIKKNQVGLIIDYFLQRHCALLNGPDLILISIAKNMLNTVIKGRY